MSNTIEQIAAGVLIFGSIGAYIAAIIGFVVLCETGFLSFTRSEILRGVTLP